MKSSPSSSLHQSYLDSPPSNHHERKKLDEKWCSPVTEDFLRDIPKTDLHVHLDGSVRLETLIELSEKENVPNFDRNRLQEVYKDRYNNLEEYLEGFKYTVAVMQNAENVERIAYEFAADNYAEGVRYFEVRFAPQLHASIVTEDRFDIEHVIRAVDNGLNRAMVEFNSKIRDEDSGLDQTPYEYGIIVSAMRLFTPEMGRYYRSLYAIHSHMSHERIAALASEMLVRAAQHCKTNGVPRIVALDIAGAEKGFRNSTHSTAFDLAHGYFLDKTVHAGEGFGPESIFQAVRDLHADRIGHGFHLFSTDLVCGEANLADPEGYVQRLTKYICDHRICVEVCMTSNLGTMPELSIENHTVKRMLENGVSVTLNTDNRLVSKTTTIKELKLAVDTFKLSPGQLREIVINGFKRSFYHGPYVQKRDYVRKAVKQYDQVAEKHGLISPP